MMECDFVTMDSPFLMKKQKSKRFSTVYKYENLKLKKKDSEETNGEETKKHCEVQM